MVRDVVRASLHNVDAGPLDRAAENSQSDPASDMS